jgi:hypothetical protein
MDGAPVLLRFEWPTGSVADLSNVDYFFVFVDGVENPVDVWLVAIEQVMKMRTLWSDGTSGRVCFQAEDRRFESSKPHVGRLGSVGFDGFVDVA